MLLLIDSSSREKKCLSPHWDYIKLSLHLCRLLQLFIIIRDVWCHLLIWTGVYSQFKHISSDYATQTFSFLWAAINLTIYLVVDFGGSAVHRKNSCGVSSSIENLTRPCVSWDSEIGLSEAFSYMCEIYKRTADLNSHTN